MIIRRLLRAPLLLALPMVFAMGACTEDLDSGETCPALCPGQGLDIRDTILTPAIVYDTTVGDYPFVGFETALLLADRGDTLDVRAVIRFDTITRLFRPTATDTVRPITQVDSATLNIRIRRTGVPFPETFFIEAYDVSDLTVPDTATTLLLPYFENALPLGVLRIDSAGFRDTTLLKIPIDTARLLDVIEDPARVLRIGLKIRSVESAEVHVITTSDAVNGPKLRFRVSPDTTVQAANLPPTSGTPASPIFSAGDFLDYSIIADAPRITRANRITVGGLPGTRGYMRFELPTWLTDSSAVLRARLELVQSPIRGLDDTTHRTLRAQMVLAGHAVTDLRRAATLLAPEGFFISDLLSVAPGDSGSRFLEINGLVRQWRTANGVRIFPNALVLRSTVEGISAFGVNFYGLNAAPELRPRLHVSYVPSIPFGQP